jgi:transposase InsO family protein
VPVLEDRDGVHRPGSPWQNPYIESFNGKDRDELHVEEFACLPEARVVIEDWRQDYNRYRPHSSLGMRAPAVFAASLADAPTGQAA